MSPENLETRVVRQEERQAALRNDFNNAMKGIREELAEMRKDSDARARERRTMLLALFVAGVGLFGSFVGTLVQLLHLGGKP